MAGRMLTRTSGGITTTFLWDSKDRIRDLTPEGQQACFRHEGEVVFRRDYGAWGETLPGGFDNVLGGMPYSFVGALGVRTDADTGMIYMRQRWYDPLLQRFISRDPIGLAGGANLYAYAGGNPSNWNDPLGLDAGSPTRVVSKTLNLTPTPAQMLLFLLMKAYEDARADLPAPGRGPSGPVPMPSPGPTPDEFPQNSTSDGDAVQQARNVLKGWLLLLELRTNRCEMLYKECLEKYRSRLPRCLKLRPHEIEYEIKWSKSCRKQLEKCKEAADYDREFEWEMPGAL